MPATPIRVLHSVSTYLNLSENWIYPQITRVPAVQVRVICSSVANLNDFPIAGGPIVNPPTWEAWFGIPRMVNALSRRLGFGGCVSRTRIRRWRPAMIHAHFGMRGFECLGLKQSLGIPLVTSFYGYDAWMLPHSDPVWLSRYERLFAAGDAFLVEGPRMCKRLIDLGCPREKIRIHRIGVDLEALAFRPSAISPHPQIVMVGRFVEKKGLIDGLRACLEARLRGVDLKVTVIGDHGVNDRAGRQIKESLFKLASEPGLSGRVAFTGFLSMGKTRETIREHQILLCPSKHAANGDAEGGSPVVLTEAMAQGLICIGTQHCDIPEVIVNGETGYLCEEGDIAGMTEVLCALAQRRDSPIGLVMQGRKHIETHFSLRTQLQKLGHIYDSLTGGPA
jgi:colanic acid/amylovoran biosynthesis glycosyltransferase